MLIAEQNDLITRTGPATPAGKLMRCYWQPAALVEELAGNRPVKPLRLLGEDSSCSRTMVWPDRAGLSASRHRPRLRPSGRWRIALGLSRLAVRCDREVPVCAHIRQKAYPVTEKSGILFAYPGPARPPEFLQFDCFVAPASHFFVFKGRIDCNWLRSLEVRIDPAHTSFLHRLDGIGPAEDWRSYWQIAGIARRKSSSWANGLERRA